MYTSRPFHAAVGWDVGRPLPTNCLYVVRWCGISWSAGLSTMLDKQL